MNPTHRFSDRVGDYARCRPSYPPEALDYLQRRGALAPGAVVADIGSGTGLLTELLLQRGNRVFGVEPNGAMRAAGERHLVAYGGFSSVSGAAEATTLPPRSVDLVIAGQAFHWFDRASARREFSRVLRRPGWVALLWNERLLDTNPFLVAYEKLLQSFSDDYAAVDHRRITDAVVDAFFEPHPVELKVFGNRQTFNKEGVRGRLLSSSYAPPAGHPQHEPMMAALDAAFDAHQVDGQVAFEYQTKLYCGAWGD